MCATKVLNEFRSTMVFRHRDSLRHNNKAQSHSIFLLQFMPLEGNFGIDFIILLTLFDMQDSNFAKMLSEL